MFLFSFITTNFDFDFFFSLSFLPERVKMLTCILHCWLIVGKDFEIGMLFPRIIVYFLNVGISKLRPVFPRLLSYYENLTAGK